MVVQILIARNLSRLTTILAMSVVMSTHSAFGQSSVIEAPSQNVNGQWNIARSTAGAQPRNSMPAKHREWERLLARDYPNRLPNGDLTVQQLLTELRDIGLPVKINKYAQSDLPVDKIVQFGPSDLSLAGKLDWMLRDTETEITFRNNFIEIISQDEASDPEHFMTITYDVTALRMPPANLKYHVTGSVNVDSWQDTGQGLGTIVVHRVNRRVLLTVSQDYRTQRAVGRLLNNLHNLSGARYAPSNAVASQSISEFPNSEFPNSELPNSELPNQENPVVDKRQHASVVEVPARRRPATTKIRRGAQRASGLGGLF